MTTSSGYFPNEENHLRLFRLLTLFSAVGVIVAGIFYKSIPHVIDPWSLRAINGILPLIILAGSYIHPKMKKNLDVLYYLWFFIDTSWVMWLFLVNKFDANYLFGVVMPLYVFFILPIRNIIQMYVFLAFSLVCAAIVLLLVTNPQMNPSVFVMMYLLNVIFIYMIIKNRLKQERLLKESESAFRTVFNESADALIIASKEGFNVIDNNLRAFELFNAKTTDQLQHSLLAFLDSNFRDVSNSFSDEVRKEGTVTTEQGKTIYGEILIRTIQLNNSFVKLIRISDISDRKEFELKLQARTKEIEEMNKFMVGRELKMAEMKKELEKSAKTS